MPTKLDHEHTYPRESLLHRFKPAFWVFSACLALGLYAYNLVSPKWVEQKTTMQVVVNDLGQYSYRQGQQKIVIDEIVPYSESPLRQAALDGNGGQPQLERQWVVEAADSSDEPPKYSILQANQHYGLWSLLPAFAAICLCLMTKEPLTSLFGGVVVGAFMLGKFNITDAVLIPTFATTNAASILLLYLWLLGGLLGIWSRTGAAQAFAEYTAKNFVRGPRSAKLVAWLLGMVFFQGGTVSTVLAGVAVKSLADNKRVSHEETSYIVDVTAAPVASLVAFNAWPLFCSNIDFCPRRRLS
jgi:hypothetical protein